MDHYCIRERAAPHPAIALGLALSVLVGACAFGASGRPAANGGARTRKAVAPAAKASGITLVWTGEQNGHLEPCGCAKPQLGGMLRRAGYLRGLAAGPSLRVDNGDLTEARGRQDELKAETTIQLLNQLQYTAINLGEADFRLGVSYLQYLASSYKGTLLCANARDAGGRPLFAETVRRVYQVGGRVVKVAVIGLLSQRYAPEVEALNSGLKIADPGETLDRLRPALAGEGFVLLLFHGEPDEARQLVSGQDWINAVIVAHAAGDEAGVLPAAPDSGRNAPSPAAPRFLTVGRDGKFVGVAEIAAPHAAGGRATLRKIRGVPLGPEIPNDTAARGIEAIYLDRVSEEGLMAKLPRVAIPNGNHFAGSAACQSCHPAPHRTWLASLHSHAWATLVHVGHQRDPDCVGCHVVGLEYQGGFRTAAQTPQLENVGCESCHGPAGRHAASPAAAPLPKIGPAACAACHVPDHSPGFDFTRYWAKIRH